jgi:hypothetical protein
MSTFSRRVEGLRITCAGKPHPLRYIGATCAALSTAPDVTDVPPHDGAWISRFQLDRTPAGP